MSTTEELRGKAFRITFDTGRMGYRVSIPNYDGGNVVRFEDAEAVISAAYSQGYKDALKWIPVEERLPAANERVLMWFRGNTPEGPEFYPMFGEINCGHWRPEGGNGNFDSHVTHWMPAPKAPRSLPIPEAQK